MHLHVLREQWLDTPSVQSHPTNRRLSQGGPGHLYLLKNKVATFAKVEKEEDMIQ